jgi:hypothetical protein
MSRKPIFILGVGAQKSGTTWLHNILSTQSYSNFGHLKEYHIWNKLLGPKDQGGNKPHLVKAEYKKNNFVRDLRQVLSSEDSNYTAYFRLLLNEKVFLTGDFSPPYALLNTTDFSYLKLLIEQSGFELKIIFVMRDPVFRLWSAVKMDIYQQKGNLETITDEMKHNLLMKALEDPYHNRRSDYLNTIRNIEKVFPNTSICYLFYEELFTQECMRKLEEFLHIKIKGADFSSKINTTPKVQINESHYDTVKAQLIKQYNFIKNHFPKQDLEIWSYK